MQDISSSHAVTHSQYLHHTDNKVPTSPTEPQRFTAGSTHPLVMSAASPVSISSRLMLYFPPSSPFTRQLCRSPTLSFCTPFYFNLSSPNLTFSHSLYKYLSLSLYPPPPTPVSRSFLKRTGECSIPCGCEHPLKVGSTAAARANRPRFLLSYRYNWRYLYSPQH